MQHAIIRLNRTAYILKKNIPLKKCALIIEQGLGHCGARKLEQT